MKVSQIWNKDVKDIVEYVSFIRPSYVRIYLYSSAHLSRQVHTELAVDLLWVEPSSDNHIYDDNNITLALFAY